MANEASGECLTPDRRWALVGAKDRAQYARLLDLPPVSHGVDPDVVARLERCRQLAEHAYFNYEFIDIALEYSVLTLEMLLRRHLRSETRRLKDLVDEARKRGWKEIARRCDRLRSVRNALAHPNHDSFGGVAFVRGVRALFEIANDVAELSPHGAASSNE